MLIRTLLLAIFLITSALSTCAAEPATMTAVSSDTAEYATMTAVSSDVAEYATLPASSSKVASARAMTMDEALKHVTVSAEDWTDGNTYYIRYTFTNPTSVTIDKKVDLTTVSYERCTTDKSFKNTHQCNDTISQLIIPPYGTFETTLAFPQTDSAEFNRHMYSKFFFDDASHIDYNESYMNRESSLFALSLVVSPQNKAYISIRNRSFFETITQIDQISIIFFNLCNCELRSAYSGPFSITIPPRQSTMLPLYQLPSQLLNYSVNDIDKETKIFYDSLHIPLGTYIFIKMNINNILHSYNGTLSIDPPYTILKEKTESLPGISNYTPFFFYPDTNSGSYRLDDSYLYTYIPLTNPNDSSLFFPTAKYNIDIDYFDQSNNYHSSKINFTLPLDITIAPHTTQYFSIKIPLPDNFKKLESKRKLSLFSFLQSKPHDNETVQDFLSSLQSSDSHIIFLYPIEKLPLPISEDDYRPLEIAASYKSLSWRVN